MSFKRNAGRKKKSKEGPLEKTLAPPKVGPKKGAGLWWGGERIPENQHFKKNKKLLCQKKQRRVPGPTVSSNEKSEGSGTMNLHKCRNRATSRMGGVP